MLTPEEPLEAGTTVKVDLVNSAGIAETVTYASKSATTISHRLDDRAQEQSVDAADGRHGELPGYHHFDAVDCGHLAGAEPPPATSSAPGWSPAASSCISCRRCPRAACRCSRRPIWNTARTTRAGLADGEQVTTPGPMLGSDDPCALSSGYSAERGPDIQLRRSSLTPVPAAGAWRAARWWCRRRPGADPRVGLCGHELGGLRARHGVPGRAGGRRPGGGHGADRGVDAKTGGHGWFTWQAPTQPGTYTLVAQRQQHHNDAAPGNNEATVEIVVEAGPRLPYRRFLAQSAAGRNRVTEDRGRAGGFRPGPVLIADRRTSVAVASALIDACLGQLDVGDDRCTSSGALRPAHVISAGSRRTRRTAQRRPEDPAHRRPAMATGIGVNDAAVASLRGTAFPLRGCPCWHRPTGPQ